MALAIRPTHPSPPHRSFLSVAMDQPPQSRPSLPPISSLIDAMNERAHQGESSHPLVCCIANWTSSQTRYFSQGSTTQNIRWFTRFYESRSPLHHRNSPPSPTAHSRTASHLECQLSARSREPFSYINYQPWRLPCTVRVQHKSRALCAALFISARARDQLLSTHSRASPMVCPSVTSTDRIRSIAP